MFSTIRPHEKVSMASEGPPHAPDTPRRFDMHALWRLAGWGAAAALALGVLALTTQTETGRERLQLAFAAPELPVRPVAVIKVPPALPAHHAEIARLQTQLHMLVADRDRLTERVASLEHSVEDLTGSIKRQSEAKPAQQPAEARAEPAVSLPKIAAPTIVRPPPPPQVKHEKGAEAAPAAAAPEFEQAKPAAAPVAAAPPQPAPPPQHQAAPERVTVPLPPVRMAALPPKSTFGIALAGASNIALLHMQWAALKANFAPLIGDLNPHALAERRGSALHYRLILGPMPTYTAAARLCARLIHAHAVCHPVRMAGEPL
jgi:hypothetical protein